jgi:hypothetical protein
MSKLTLHLKREEKAPVPVICEEVPYGSFSPLYSGIRQVKVLDDFCLIEQLQTSANPMPESERNMYELPSTVITSEDGVVDMDSLYNTVSFVNEVTVDEEQVEKYKHMVQEESEDIKQILFEGGASSVLAFDEAAGYTEAVLRDVFGADAEVEQNVLEAASMIMNLNMVCFFAGKAKHLTKSVRNSFLTKFAEEAAVSAVEAVNKKQKNTRYNAQLSALNARVKNKQAQGTDPIVESPLGNDQRSNLGSVRTRG